MQELREEEFSQVFENENEQSKEKVPVWQPNKTDCHVETDLELLIPEWYIGSIPERMRLYKELDSLTQISELKSFESKLKDRFGNLPQQVVELLNVVRIRWIAQQLGMEKVLLKNKSFLGYFISNQISPFYRSTIFASIIGYIQQNPKVFQLKEQREKLYIIAKNIEDTREALNLLDTLHQSIIAKQTSASN